MSALPAFLTERFERTVISYEVKWLMIFVSAVMMQASLFALFESPLAALPLLFVSILFLGLALIPSYWMRFALLAFWTAGLVADLLVRRNPFSVFFILVGALHLYHMLRATKPEAEAAS